MKFEGCSAATTTREPTQKNLRPADGSLQHDALMWAVANRGDDGALPRGKVIAERFGRHERWGRLVKQRGDLGQVTTSAGGSVP
jgi:hypothetical protein